MLLKEWIRHLMYLYDGYVCLPVCEGSWALCLYLHVRIQFTARSARILVQHN